MSEFPGLDELTLAVRRTSEALRGLTARKARELGVNPTDMTTLYLLDQEGPLGVGDLSARLGLRTASTTALVDRLERAGHVARSPDRRDGRRVLVSITESTRRANLALWWPAISALDEVSRSLPAEHRAVVVDYLQRIVATMSP